MWGTVLNLVQYPTTLIFNVWPNVPSIKSYMVANIGPQQGVGVAKTHGARGHKNLWRLLYKDQNGTPMGVYLPSNWRSEALKTQLLPTSLTPETHVTAPEPRKMWFYSGGPL